MTHYGSKKGVSNGLSCEVLRLIFSSAHSQGLDLLVSLIAFSCE